MSFPQHLKRNFRDLIDLGDRALPKGLHRILNTRAPERNEVYINP